MHRSEVIVGEADCLLLKCLECGEIYWREFDGVHERNDPTLINLNTASNHHERTAHAPPPTEKKASTFDIEAFTKAQPGISARGRKHLGVLMRRRDFLERKNSEYGTSTPYQKSEQQALEWAVNVLCKTQSTALNAADIEEK